MKVLIYIGIFLIIIILAFATFFKSGISSKVVPDSMAGHHNGGATENIVVNGKYNSLPEKCQLPAGQDIESWKEHLGHHAETRDCLQYFK